jgi:leucyl-tRNA synthetase
MVPHLAEEGWAHLGQPGLIADAPWPVADPALLEDDTVTIAIQVNGKLKDSFEVAKGTDKAVVEAAVLTREKVIRALEGRPLRKVIIVPDRLVNLVA